MNFNKFVKYLIIKILLLKKIFDISFKKIDVYYYKQFLNYIVH
jgi:hypothetical protein